MSQDNIKSNKEPRFLPLFRRYAFEKPQGGGGAAILGLMSEKYKKISKYLSYVELLLISLALFHLIKFLHMLH